MKDKTKQIWYLYENDLKQLKNDCYNMLQELFIQLGQKPESEMVVILTNTFVDDLATKYQFMELEWIKYALNRGLRETDPPVFEVPVPSKVDIELLQSKLMIGSTVTVGRPASAATLTVVSSVQPLSQFVTTKI